MERDHHRQPGSSPDEPVAGLPAVSGIPRRQPPLLPPGPLVGRENDLATLRALLLDPSIRIVSMLGPGGVGKTRLALTLAHDLAPRFEHGVLFLRLDRVFAGSLWETIGRQLSLTPAAGEAWDELVPGALTAQHLLLVLDNCESVLDSLDDLPALMASCPRVTVLTTSRETLHLPGEHEVWLSPLPVSEPGDATGRFLNPAVRLFLLRARQVRSDFDVSPENRDTLWSIVQKLDGLPLAIELTAAYLRHLSLDEVLSMLEDAMPSLAGGSRSLPARQQSLRELVRWSLDTLPDTARRDAVRLSIFPDGFSPRAAAALLDNGSRQAAWDLIMTLADKSLVTRASAGGTTEARFHMLQTIKSVLREELEATPSLYTNTLERLTRALVAYAREADRHYHGPDSLLWLRRMREIHADVHMIVTISPGIPEIRAGALELCGYMFWFWYTQGHYQWALPRIEDLLEHVGETVSVAVRARAHVTAGWLAHRMAQISRAQHHFEVARGLFGPVPDRASLLGTVGHAYALSFDRRDTPGAIRELEEVIAQAPSVENAWHEEAAGHFGIGILLYFDGRHAEARQHFMETTRLGRAHNDGQAIGMSLMYLAHVDRAEGNPADAFWKLREALPLLMEIGDRATAAVLLDIVASALVELKAFELAMRAMVVGEHLRATMRIPRAPLEQPDADATRARIDEWRASRPHGVAGPETIDLGETIDLLLRFLPENGEQPDEPAPEPDAKDVASPPTRLTPRELEVLHLVATGMTSSEIASALFVSQHTVKRHMANIREKLGVRSQAAAIAALRDRRT